MGRKARVVGGEEQTSSSRRPLLAAASQTPLPGSWAGEKCWVAKTVPLQTPLHPVTILLPSSPPLPSPPSPAFEFGQVH
jgi:hypothetical protein